MIMIHSKIIFYVEKGLYTKNIVTMLHSKIIFYLLQNGCTLEAYVGGRSLIDLNL